MMPSARGEPTPTTSDTIRASTHGSVDHVAKEERCSNNMSLPSHVFEPKTIDSCCGFSEHEFQRVLAIALHHYTASRHRIACGLCGPYETALPFLGGGRWTTW